MDNRISGYAYMERVPLSCVTRRIFFLPPRRCSWRPLPPPGRPPPPAPPDASPHRHPAMARCPATPPSPRTTAPLLPRTPPLPPSSPASLPHKSDFLTTPNPKGRGSHARPIARKSFRYGNVIGLFYNLPNEVKS
jgi:hypothetical protein